MSQVPQAIHSNLSRPHPTDSRLLQNLIKGEKSYIENLAGTSMSGHAAASALAAWGTSEAPDIAKASQTLAEILASVADAQRMHVQAMDGYRSALKDVLDREQSIRSVVRDRDILVGRLIKASKKKVSKKDSGLSQDEKMEKVNAAQRELHACEQVLASEEAALVGVKRRTFKEALTMRMKTMGDAGAAMVDAAKEAILLLDEFDTHGPLLQATGGGQYESMYADDGVEMGAYDNQALDNGYYGQPQQSNAYGNGDADPQDYAPANGANLVRDDHGGFHKSLQDGQNLDPRSPQHFDIASVTPSQSASQVVGNHDRSHVPLGQRYTSQFEDVEEQEGVPSDTDSEEDYRRAFIEPRMRMPAPHELGVPGETQELFIPQSMPQQSRSKQPNGGEALPPAPPRKDVQPTVPMPPVPTAPVFDVNQARSYNQSGVPPRPPPRDNNNNDDSDSDDDDGRAPRRHSSAFNSWGSNHASAYSPTRGTSNRQSMGSEGGYTPGHQRKSSNSLLGKMGKLFRTDLRNAPVANERPGWDTRIAGRSSQDTSDRKRSGLLRRNDPDSSDEEPDNREVFRNINTPRGAGGSDVGSTRGKLSRAPSILPGPKSNKATREEQAELERIRASVVGGGIANNAPPAAQQPVASGAASIHSNAKTKKKKKRTVAGSEVGTAPTRPAGTYTVSGDLSSLHKPEPGAAPGLSRSSTMKSTSSKKKNRASLSGAGFGDGNVFNPNAGKFATASWINKPASQMTAYEAVAMAGVVPKSAAPKPKAAAASGPTSPTTETGSLTVPAGTSRPASIMSSASQKPPLKSALKSPGLSRSNSSASAKGPTSSSSPAKKSALTGSTQSALRNEVKAAEPLPVPKMAPVPQAPAPVTSAPLPPSEPKLAPVPQAPASVTSQPKAQVPPPTQQKPTAAAPSSAEEPSSLPVAEHVQTNEAPKSVLSIEEDKNFDGTGRLDVPVGGDAVTAQNGSANATAGEDMSRTSTRVPMPKLDMPSSEPFSFDIDKMAQQGQNGRRGSAITTGSNVEDNVVTPGIEQTYKAFIQTHSEPSPAEVAREQQVIQPQPQTGVTRLTDRKVKLEPSRVYGAGGPELSDSSSEEGSAVQRAAQKEQSHAGAQKAAEVQAASTLADPSHKPEPALQNLTVASIGPAKAPPSETDSAVGNRKSVRLAPDTKLPPDTPTSDDVHTPRGNEYGGHDPIAHKALQINPKSGTPAPRRSIEESADLNHSAGTARPGWTTRIRDTHANDSSDEDNDDTDYASARKAFGRAERGYGEATGTAKPKAKKGTADAASLRSRNSVSSKKGPKKTRSALSGSTYENDATAAATTKPAAATASVGYVPTAPGPITSMYSATAPGSVTNSGPVPTTSMYSVTAPASVISGGGGGGGNSAAAAPSTPTHTTTTTMTTATAPAPLTASNLSAVEASTGTGTGGKPTMPPVPVAPPAAGASSISVPTAPPPATESPKKKGLFSRFKKNK
ncbi:hypothetical protein BCV70DRAFT_202126 [Testicularia cyperi]|uniref:Eisosome component PIL1-domain-containing protein n=1 Tax=Testicularia cyperi TaxID=1882483 RepID=A0A317XJ56_9BASI|nr:hypothetical protein BCV70DRAFT_202126 [Testicularia cyperi]